VDKDPVRLWEWFRRPRRGLRPKIPIERLVNFRLIVAGGSDYHSELASRLFCSHSSISPQKVGRKSTRVCHCVLLQGRPRSRISRPSFAGACSGSNGGVAKGSKSSNPGLYMRTRLYVRFVLLHVRQRHQPILERESLCTTSPIPLRVIDLVSLPLIEDLALKPTSSIGGCSAVEPRRRSQAGESSLVHVCKVPKRHPKRVIGVSRYTGCGLVPLLVLIKNKTKASLVAQHEQSKPIQALDPHPTPSVNLTPKTFSLTKKRLRAYLILIDLLLCVDPRRGSRVGSELRVDL
jgi:hypothetical protein